MAAQTESTPTPTCEKIKEWLAFAPLETDVRAIHGRLDRMDSHIRGLSHSMKNGFKAVRQDLSAFSERLIRLETLLEQVISQPDVPQ